MYIQRGAMTRDLSGEEKIQFFKDNFSFKNGKVGTPKNEFRVFRGFNAKYSLFPDEGPELFDWQFSTENIDRQGDIVKQNFELSNYLANPVILWAHDHKIPAIGRAIALSTNNGLSGRIAFNGDFDPFARSIVERVKFGSISSGSIGFMPGEVEMLEERVGDHYEITGFILDKNELWEFSICNVPANPMALVINPEDKQIKAPASRGITHLFRGEKEC